MAFDFVSVEIEDDDNILARVFGEYPAKYEHFVDEAVGDIADEIDHWASIFAPERSGDLKENPTVRTDEFGHIETRAPLFVKKGEAPGSKFAIRGAKGFVPGTAGIGGKSTRHIEITLPGKESDLHYAYFVHYGTKQYEPIEPKHHQYMVFFSRGKWWRMLAVQGQEPQPYLTEAYEYVDHSYVPTRLEELRLEIEGVSHT